MRTPHSPVCSLSPGPAVHVRLQGSTRDLVSSLLSPGEFTVCPASRVRGPHSCPSRRLGIQHEVWIQRALRDHRPRFLQVPGTGAPGPCSQRAVRPEDTAVNQGPEELTSSPGWLLRGCE